MNPPRQPLINKPLGDPLGELLGSLFKVLKRPTQPSQRSAQQSASPFSHQPLAGALLSMVLTLGFLAIAPGALLAQSSSPSPFFIAPEAQEAITSRYYQEYRDHIEQAKEQAQQAGVAYQEPSLLRWDPRGFLYLGASEAIWYPAIPAGEKKFLEDWPTLRSELQKRGFSIPTLALGPSPWRSGEELEADLANLTKEDSQIINPAERTRKRELEELLTFLKREDVIKVEYTLLIDRLERALDPQSETYLFANLPPGKGAIMEKNFRELASLQDSLGHPLGLYALVDYCNFKGEGIAAAEHYNTQAWGLSELLFEMEDLRSNRPLLEKYIDRLELQQKRSDLTAENLTPLELFVLRGAKVLDDRIENNIMERDRIKGTAGYEYFLAHYGEEAASRTPQEEAERQGAFESLFGLPYKDNSQYRQSLFYPHLLGYLHWPTDSLAPVAARLSEGETTTANGQSPDPFLRMGTSLHENDYSLATNSEELGLGILCISIPLVLFAPQVGVPLTNLGIVLVGTGYCWNLFKTGQTSLHFPWWND